MISLLQRLLSKHYKWMFAVLLVIIIIPFVFTVGSSPGIVKGNPDSEPMPFYGYDLHSEADVQELGMATNLSFLLFTGQDIQDPMMLEQMSLARAAVLGLADSLHLPAPSESQLKKFIEQRPVFLDDEGQFNPETYENFLSYVDANPVMTENFVRQTIAQDYRIETLRTLMHANTFVLPFEAVILQELEQTHFTAELARLEMSDLDFSAEISADELRSFYNDHQNAYALPEQYAAEAITFSASSFLSQIPEPSDAQLKPLYDAYVKHKGDEAKAFDAMRQSLAKTYKLRQALRIAEQTANNFLLAVYNDRIQIDSDAWSEILVANKAQASALPPISMQDVLNKKTQFGDVSLSTELLVQLPSLTAEHFYSEPVTSKEAVQVLVLREKLPARIPPLADVESRVQADCLKAKQKTFFDHKAQKLDALISAEVAKGTPFDDVARKHGLAVERYEFNLTEVPVSLRLFGDLPNMKPGQIAFQKTGADSAALLYLESRKTPTLSSSNPAVEETRQQLEKETNLMAFQNYITALIESGLNTASK